ncbi:dihydrodipicolinate synthase family protein [Hydrogenophaga sp.]|uniref:dihydrodipicolinate synthase family protein n=1 Tax=Hydrogenophaga sp. TaxID=1904254 RepID=UPI00271BDDC6|nr:dihydrodipicolinate synthase family protein [Hydrogenophaga sp.]MDO9434201.1 dihydrodipicolinate synthase family protein [Hydrogenophaga sp.]
MSFEPQRLSAQSAGVFVISVTPFTPEGELDLPSTDALVDFYLERGATGLTLLGMMGEAVKLTAAESQRFVDHVVRRVAGRAPVVVGVSSAGFAAMRELTAASMDLGAAGVMIAPPSSLRSDDQILNYYAGVADAVGSDTPFVLQDFPLSTGVVISSAVILKIVERHANCVMLKHEDWPGLSKVSALRAAQAAGTSRRIGILVGNGGMFLPEELERGADGAMTGFGFPEMMVDVMRAHAAGDGERARDLFDAYLPLARYEQQPGLGLAVRKHVLAQRGAIRSATLRTPGPVLSAADVDDVHRLMQRQARRLEALS